MKKQIFTLLALLLTIAVTAQDFTNFYTAYRAHNAIVTDDSLIYAGCSNAINIYHKDGQYKTSIGTDGEVYSATRDNSGNLWFSVNAHTNETNGGGIIKYDGLSWKFIPVNDNFVYMGVNSITCDKNNNIWICNATPYNTNPARISKYDGIQWTDYSVFADTLVSYYADQIVCDSNNIIYAGIQSDNIAGIFGVIAISETDSILYNYTNSGITVDCKHASCVDRQNRVWFGGCYGHINSFENGNWIVYDDYNIFGSKSFSAIYQDTTGYMWLGTEGKIFIQNDTGWIVNNSLEQQSVFTITEIVSDAEENVWLAGNFDYDDIRRGCLIKPVADTFKLLYPQSHIGYPREIAFKNNKIWLGKGAYLSFFDGEKWNNTFSAENMCPEYTTSICTDSYGDLWYGTQSGLFKQTEGQTAEQILQLCGEDILSVQCIASFCNSLWVKASGMNLYKFNGTEWSKIDMSDAASSTFLKIVARNENEIWVASYAGAIKFDGTNWLNYSTETGLLSSTVNDFAFQNDTVWIATRKGIALLYNNQISIFHNDSTFVSGYSNYNSVFVDKLGTKWAGSQKGVLKFNGLSSEYLYPTGIKEKIYSIAEDTDKNLWFCGSNAVSKYTFDNSGVVNLLSESNCLIIYPNPANDKFNIYCKGFKENDDLEILTISGKNIASYKITKPTTTIDISDLKPGIYLLHLKNTGEYGKIIVK